MEGDEAMVENQSGVDQSTGKLLSAQEREVLERQPG